MSADIVEHIAGVPVLMCDPAGPVLGTEADALDLLVAAGPWGAGASWVALPENRLSGDFYRLRTGLAGAIMQKFVNYHMGLVILGDLTARTATSPTLRDLVRESNRGKHIWFVSTVDELRGQLARLQPSA